MKNNEILQEKKDIDKFIEALRIRLHQKVDEGFVGWDYGYDGLGSQPEDRLAPTASTEDLIGKAERALRNRKYIDLVAFAGFLWNRDVTDVKNMQNELNTLQKNI